MNRDYPWLDLDVVLEWEPLAEERDVSRVARSARGFLRQYEDAGGDPDQLDPAWRAERNAFVARHLAQLRQNGEPWFEVGKSAYAGDPTRRHLALIMWAYSPSPRLL